ncbi:MAG: hypothetical protein BV459_00235 [Thermoplasmata archaeon M11B2D]|nr:MAG: hypothetical protein BV459_00235 [Thermoplasmata archaeon M11B2D]
MGTKVIVRWECGCEASNTMDGRNRMDRSRISEYKKNGYVAINGVCHECRRNELVAKLDTMDREEIVAALLGAKYLTEIRVIHGVILAEPEEEEEE